MTLRIYLGVTDPSARRRIRELIGKDPSIVLVTDLEDADVVVGDAASRKRAMCCASWPRGWGIKGSGLP